MHDAFTSAFVVNPAVLKKFLKQISVVSIPDVDLPKDTVAFGFVAQIAAMGLASADRKLGVYTGNDKQALREFVLNKNLQSIQHLFAPNESEIFKKMQKVAKTWLGK